jgi:alpha-amylase
MQHEHWQQCQVYEHKLAQLNKRVQQLEQHVPSPANGPNITTSSSSRAVSQPAQGCSSSSSSSNKAGSKRCTVQFSITCPTEFGQRLWLVGDAAGLGSWDVSSGLRLKWAEGGKWVGSVGLDAGATPVIKYKAVLQCGPGQYKWAAGANFELALTAARHSVEHVFA